MVRARLLWATAALVAAATGACNTRQSVIDTTAPTVPSSLVGTPSVPASVLVAVTVEPTAVFSGEAATGRVLLSFPAPPDGVAVALSTANAAATVPPIITVPAGADAAQFPIASQLVPSEMDVAIVAQAGDRTAQTTLALWTKTPSFVATWLDQGNQQRPTVSRVSASGQWRGNCYGNGVSVGASQSAVTYSLFFAAPREMPLIAGTYENAQTIWDARVPSRPVLDVTAPGFSSCRAPQTSRFEVKEADLLDDFRGTVRRFAVTFEQQCGAVTIRGELSAVDVPPTTTGGPRCILPD